MQVDFVSALLKDGKMFIKVKEIESKDKTFYKFKLTDQASQELLKMHKIYEWMRPMPLYYKSTTNLIGKMKALEHIFLKI